MKSFLIGTLWLSSLLLPIQATTDTVRDVHRELANTVGLGSAVNYTILTKAGISVTVGTDITGDIATSPAAHSYLTGFGLISNPEDYYSDSALVTDGHLYGANHLGATPADLTVAVGDMMIAYAEAESRTNTDAARINLATGLLGTVDDGSGTSMVGGPGDSPLTPGVYTFTTDVVIGGSIEFHGAGTYIFQITGNLNFEAGSMTCHGGNQPCDIFWQVAKEVHVAESQIMQGTILAKTDVVFEENSTLFGHIYSQTHCELKGATITP